MAKKHSKIIFLDFDGVLNTEYHQRQLQFEGKIWQDKHGASFDPKAVKQLQAIVDKTHADIVIEELAMSHQHIESTIKLSRIFNLVLTCHK